jgi:hypothetical protein
LTTPPEDGPLIPTFPASYYELEPYILCESDIWKRVDQEYSSSDEIAEFWRTSGPQYTWQQYRMILTSARRVLARDYRDHCIPPDLDTHVCIHLFKIQKRSRPATASETAGKYDPEVTRRTICRNTVISTFQPYTVDIRERRPGHIWKDEDDEVDVTEICEIIRGRSEHTWYLTLPSLYVLLFI